MTEVAYTPVGRTPQSLRVIVAGSGVVVLGEGASDAAALAVRERLADGGGFAAVVDALAAGGSLSTLPPFVVVVDEDTTWRVSARGGIAAVVSTASGSENVDGSGASTWSERSIPGVEKVTVGGSAGEGAPSASLPLADGIVLAEAVVVSARPAGRTAPPATPPAGRTPDLIEPVQPHSAAEVRDLDEADPAAAGAAGSVAPAAAAGPAAPASPAQSSLRPPAPPVDDSQTLIDSIPPFVLGSALQSWRNPAPSASSDPSASPASAPRTPAAPVTAAIPAPALGGEGVGDDLEATVVAERPARGGAPAPAAPVTPAPVAPAQSSRSGATPLTAGDHDGETLSLEEVRRLRAAGAAVPPAPTPPAPAPPVTPPPVVTPAAPSPRKGPLAQLRLSTGQIVPLDRTVIVGRRPRSTRASSADLPHLIGVDSPEQDISRNHVEVRVEGDSILATDLQTTNGTTLRRPGTPATRLHPGEATIVVPGDVLDIGDDVTIAVEALP